MESRKNKNDNNTNQINQKKREKIEKLMVLNQNQLSVYVCLHFFFVEKIDCA